MTIRWLNLPHSPTLPPTVSDLQTLSGQIVEVESEQQTDMSSSSVEA